MYLSGLYEAGENGLARDAQAGRRTARPFGPPSAPAPELLLRGRRSPSSFALAAFRFACACTGQASAALFYQCCSSPSADALSSLRPLQVRQLTSWASLCRGATPHAYAVPATSRGLLWWCYYLLLPAAAATPTLLRLPPFRLVSQLPLRPPCRGCFITHRAAAAVSPTPCRGCGLVCFAPASHCPTSRHSKCSWPPSRVKRSRFPPVDGVGSYPSLSPLDNP